MQMNLATVHTNQLNALIDISKLSHCTHTQRHTLARSLSEVKTIGDRICHATYGYADTHKQDGLHNTQLKLLLTQVNYWQMCKC